VSDKAMGRMSESGDQLVGVLDRSLQRSDALRAAFAKHGVNSRSKPTRKQIETTLDVLGWLSSGDQDPGMKDDIAAVRMLLDQLLEVGW
jgi:hypothetical protein